MTVAARQSRPARHAGDVGKSPAARRQKRLRARRKAGLAIFSLTLPVSRLEQVVRARENLPADAPVSRRQIKRTLLEGIEWWSRPWITLRRVTRDTSK